MASPELRYHEERQRIFNLSEDHFNDRFMYSLLTSLPCLVLSAIEAVAWLITRISCVHPKLNASDKEILEHAAFVAMVCQARLDKQTDRLVYIQHTPVEMIYWMTVWFLIAVIAYNTILPRLFELHLYVMAHPTSPSGIAYLIVWLWAVSRMK